MGAEFNYDYRREIEKVLASRFYVLQLVGLQTVPADLNEIRGTLNRAIAENDERNPNSFFYLGWNNTLTKVLDDFVSTKELLLLSEDGHYAITDKGVKDLVENQHLIRKHIFCES